MALQKDHLGEQKIILKLKIFHNKSNILSNHTTPKPHTTDRLGKNLQRSIFISPPKFLI